MWFRNGRVYRIFEADGWTLEALSEALAAHAFRPCSDHQARAHGWVPPMGRHGDQLVLEVNGQRLLKLQLQERLLPPAVVSDELEKRAAQLEADQGYMPGRREKQSMKERIIEELLPRAFVRNQHVDLWWDTTRGRIVVDTSSGNRADQAIDALRQALGSLKAAPLAVTTPPARTMTAWLGDPAARPDGLLLGDMIELRSRADDDGRLKASNIDPDGEEMRTALELGRQVTSMALSVEGRASLRLTDGLTLRSIRFDDALLEEADERRDGDDPGGNIRTDFMLMTSALGCVIDALVQWLGGEAECVPADAP